MKQIFNILMLLTLLTNIDCNSTEQKHKNSIDMKIITGINCNILQNNIQINDNVQNNNNDNNSNNNKFINGKRYRQSEKVIKKQRIRPKIDTSKDLLSCNFNKQNCKKITRQCKKDILTYDKSYKAFLRGIKGIFEYFHGNTYETIIPHTGGTGVRDFIKDKRVSLEKVKQIAILFDNTQPINNNLLNRNSNNINNNSVEELEQYISKHKIYGDIPLVQLYYYVMNQSRNLYAYTMQKLKSSITSDPKQNSALIDTHLSIANNFAKILRNIALKLQDIIAEVFGYASNIYYLGDNSYYKSAYGNLKDSALSIEASMTTRASEFDINFLTAFNSVLYGAINKLNLIKQKENSNDKIQEEIDNISEKIKKLKTKSNEVIKSQFDKYHKFNANVVDQYLTELKEILITAFNNMFNNIIYKLSCMQEKENNNNEVQGKKKTVLQKVKDLQTESNTIKACVRRIEEIINELEEIFTKNNMPNNYGNIFEYKKIFESLENFESDYIPADI